MRILTVSDKVEPVLYSPYLRERVGQIDLVLACGDLPYYYLEYIVDTLDVPLFFVHGNHDKVTPAPEGQEVFTSPAALGWAVNLHGRSVLYKGLLLAGMEGSPVYNPGAPFQYGSADVFWQMLGMAPGLWLNRLQHGRFLDILITHAPPRGIHDDKDIAHRGFEGYLAFLQRYRPLLMVHGHQHIYNRNEIAQTDYSSTCIINTYGYRVLELEPRPTGRGWQLIGNR
jgi:uncharacterized protein